MNRVPTTVDSEQRDALRRLAEIQQRTDLLQARFDRLQQDVVQAETALEKSLAASLADTNAWLVEANAHLVISTLMARSEAETATLALQHAPHLAGHETLGGVPDRTLPIDHLIVTERLHAAVRMARRAGATDSAGGRTRSSADGRSVHMREANEQMVLSTLTAQASQAIAERAQRVQNEFLTIAAHELRNPLAPLRTAASLISRVPASELPQLQAVIERQAAHIGRLVGDLLDLARISSGKLRLDLKTVEMIALLRESIDAFRPSVVARQQQLRIDLPSAPVPMQADPVRFTQIVSNLLDNASKYTPEGGSVDISAAVSNATLFITISDTGIGISADALPHIFEPFVQDAHAPRFNGEGLGIGLTVVRELVQSHGGEVIATSAGHHQGSQFRLSIPLEKH